MEEYFGISDSWFSRFLPEFDYILTDLSHYSDEQLKSGIFKRAALEIGLLIQKNIFDENKLISHLKSFLEIGKFYFSLTSIIIPLKQALRKLPAYATLRDWKYINHWFKTEPIE